MQKTLNKKTVNAIAHNLIVGDAITHAWDFVTNMQVHNEFDYAFVNSAADDYCDTCWHTTQNVKLGQSMDLIDQKDMADTAYNNFMYAFEDVNIAEITVEDVYKALDSIDGDTAMRENYYMQLQQHFKNFVESNTQYKLVENKKYKGNYTLVSKHTAKQKEKMVVDYLNKYDAYEHIELNNELGW
tara:strand:- start:27 stop:581 length:555 start_codon:yes stop_codon:yes gene_type:complete